ncbi:MAG: TIM44-like domain-containing protein, partial [Bacteroidota bacterium]
INFNIMKKLQKFMSTYKVLFLTFLLISLSVLLADDLYARVGGAGGSSSGGGDGDGIGGLIIYIFMLIPFPFNIIAIALIIVGYIYLNKKRKQKSILNKLPGGGNLSDKKPAGYDMFLTNNPGFDEGKFKEKVKTAFVEIQKAWEAKDMGKVRKYISDGMYQRLNTQFKMMDVLGQKNTLEKIDVKNVVIDKIESDGLFDIVHVAVHAFIVDKFVSDKYKELNSGGSETFVEYWSFLKKRGAQEHNLFASNNCPKCGGELPTKAGEVAKCEFCGTYTNSGEYDWVLSEITQADDYISANPMVFKAANLQEAVMEMVSSDDDFSAQLIEDKASNGYLQIETARVFKDTKVMRRFVSDNAFEKLSKQFEGEEKFVYNRLFLNDVTLIGAMQKDNKNVLMVAIKSSYQRVAPADNKVNILDPVVSSKTEVVILEKDMQSEKSKGSLYAHSCPSCGGPLGDTLDLKCQYCGAELNSPKTEWIITDVMSIYEYQAYYAANGANFVAKVDPDKLDGLFKVRDYAFNNVLILVAADGVFDKEEMEFTKKLAKKWGYSLDKIQPMFEMAQSGKLVIRMPEDAKMKEKIYKLMEKAANIDGNISGEEQNVLDSVKKKYLAQ